MTNPSDQSSTVVAESIDVAVNPVVAYKAISDMSRMVSWSPEFSQARQHGTQSLRVGDQFGGSNKRGIHRWRTTSTVIAARSPVEFAFEVAAVGMPVARWTYTIEPTTNGCRVTEAWTDLRHGIIGFTIKSLGLVASGVWDRSTHNREGMKTTLALMKADLEAGKAA